MKNTHPIEISPPDITGFKAGNAGVDYVQVFDSGKPGPNVMVQALTHGNEFCGALALKGLLDEKIKPSQGR
ncbi:MAG: succinylglutamate desuccinylase, partial [Candidatus Parcubacteria bacterium]|nr:succinylglutamate desuccinylase [Burkholderiales bacterium]